MKKDKQYLFSVVVTIWNIEKYLEEAIDSVINQTLSFKENVELILVNDGSPDNSDIICKKYAKKYPKNIIYIEKENGGVSSARNAGIDVATGKYINFLDADDYFSENAFMEIKDFIEKHNDEADVIALNLINFENSEGSWVNGPWFEKTQLINMEQDSDFMQCQVGASFVKSSAAKKYRFDTAIIIHEDSHYLYRIFCENPYCGVISGATYFHRIRASKTSATQTIKHKKNIIDIANKTFKELVDCYIEKYSYVPDFVQTFIIVEFNYYVIENASKCNFSRDEKQDLISKLKYILDNISEENILNHFVLNEQQKKRFLLAKNNIKLIFKDESKITRNVNVDTQKIFSAVKSAGGKTKKVILWLPRKIKRRIFKGITSRVDELESKATETQKHAVLTSTNVMGISQGLNDKVDKTDANIHINKNKLDSEILNIKRETGFYDDMNIKYCLYFHGGSRNHGCEALVRTFAKELGEKRENYLLHTSRKTEDLKFGIDKVVKYIEELSVTNPKEKTIFLGDTICNEFDLGVEEIASYFNKDTIALSIGGDNYCYGDYVASLLSTYNKQFHKYGVKTALVGCSIDPEVLKKQKILKDLNNYDLILARETITYDALLEAGIDKNTHLVPDTAFVLDAKKANLPENFVEGNTIGLNISPYVQGENRIVFENFKTLIEHIISNTDYNVVLIPHVLWEGISDMESLEKLYELFSHTNRISLVGDRSAGELKYIISKCKMFIGSRTHSTIAAYSSLVPTLAIGYSIKSKGIAKDLFGDYRNYVIPTEDIKKDKDLINSFKWLEKNYNKIKRHLEKTIPEYIKPIGKLSDWFDDLRKKKVIKELPPKKGCSGCSACINICPISCIEMEVDEEGFKYPVTDYKKCTNCNLCKITCPRNNNYEKVNPIKVLAVKNKKDIVRKNSSSGGVFYELAKSVIEKDGVVFGAALNDKLELEHIMVDNIKGLKKLQGSKYVQSDLKKVFSEVKELLKSRKVLFSGVPCQIQGLKAFLKMKYDNLLCVDVICHGVPSPKVFRKYIESIERDKNVKISSVNFRNKDSSWKNYNFKVSYKNGNESSVLYSQDLYMRGFLKNLYLRPNCHDCPANNFRSGSDITLGDYWGIENYDEKFDDDKGVSLVLIKTKLGEEVFEDISKEFRVMNTKISFALENNPCLVKSWGPHINRERFFDSIDGKDIIKNISDNLD